MISSSALLKLDLARPAKSVQSKGESVVGITVDCQRGQKRQRAKQLALQRIGNTDVAPTPMLRRESRYGQSYGA